MILINEDNKAHMVRQKIPVLDYYFDKVSMVLWPRFTAIIEALVDNVKKANKKQFKLNQALEAHSSILKYTELASGLYKIANKSS